MIKKEIITAVSRETGLTKRAVSSVLESILQNIQTSLSRGEEVTLQGFGKFKIKYSPERKGWDFKEQKQVVVPPKAIPVFQSGTNLTNAISDLHIEN